jgi:hypothetical protein
MSVAARMNGTPESSTATGNTLPEIEWPSCIGSAVPFRYTVIARTSTSQKRTPWSSDTRVEYCILLGSEMSSEGCRPMPSSDGTALDPGRERESERNRDAGAESTGVMLKRLEVNGAPSGPFPSMGGICWAMIELRGSARPRMPSNSYSSGSESTLVAAARRGQRER